MAKEKQPLLSLEAHGTIADTLTYQRSKGQNIARQKPRLPYFLTLPVQYQRWLYEDYAYLWRQQSAATQKTYRANGVRHHLTGFQYWMKDMLTRLPDIAAMWHLDVPTGATTPDSSRNANTGTILGASPATGLIDGCLSFDGINDQVTFPDSPSLRPTSLTIEMFMRFDGTFNLPANKYPLYKPFTGGTWVSYLFLVDFGDNINARISRAGVLQQTAPYHITDRTFRHYAMTFDDPTLTLSLWIGGYFHNSVVVPVAAWDYDAFSLYLNQTSNWNMLQDHVVIYNRALDSTEILRHSLRRWPPQ